MRDLPAPQWASDPLGRHQVRYWDGTAWTAHVSDDGVTSMDAVPGLVGATAVVSGRPASAVRRPAPSSERNSIIVAVCALALIGTVAGVAAFSGLSGSRSTSITPVAGPATTSSPEPTTLQLEPMDPGEPTMYRGPTMATVDSLPEPPSTPTTPRTTTSTTTSTTSSSPSRTAPATTTAPRTTPTAPATTATTRPTTPRPTVTTTRPLPTTPPVPTTRPTELIRYPSCEAMHENHPHGVGRPGARDRRNGTGGGQVRDFTVDGPLYQANVLLDVDVDGIACEA